MSIIGTAKNAKVTLDVPVNSGQSRLYIRNGGYIVEIYNDSSSGLDIYSYKKDPVTSALTLLNSVAYPTWDGSTGFIVEAINNTITVSRSNGASLLNPTTDTANSYPDSGVWSIDNATLVSFVSNDAYTVTYAGNGGAGTAPATQSGAASYTVATNTFTKAGYTFAGWNTAANGSGTPYSAGSTITPTANTTLYAQWAVTIYTVTYAGNGGAGTAPATQSGAASYTVAANTFSKNNYTFNGWNTATNGSGTSYAVGSTITPSANTTLYAQWVFIGVTEYVVTLNSNGGEVNPNSLSYTGIAVDLPTPTYTNYNFNGWYTAATGGSLVSSPYAPTADTTLYAQWTLAVALYTVTLVYNNGSENTLLDYTDTALTLPTPSRTGYIFRGWYTLSSGGTLIRSPYTPTVNTTIYAQWNLPTTPGVTVSEKWVDNQASIIATQGLVAGYMETVESGIPNDWSIDNTAANNLATLDTIREFDYSRTALPLSTTTAVIENGIYNYESNPAYDFAIDSVKNKAEQAGIISFDMGYIYDDSTTELVPWTTHVLSSISIDDDDASVTINGYSSLGALDNGNYYRGRFYTTSVSSPGISAYDLIDDILTTQSLSIKGYNNYILGRSDCKTSTTKKLFTTYTLANYTIDTALQSVMVYNAIPICSYRQALNLVCAYAGAYVLEQRDGSLRITTNLYEPSDYVFDETSVYDRPKRITGQKIKDCSITLNSTYCDTTVDYEIQYDGTLVLQTANAPQIITITYDNPVANSSVSAWMTNDVTKTSIIDTSYSKFLGTYGATLRVIPTGGSRSIRIQVTGLPVSVTSSTYTQTYKEMGDSVSIDCAVASDPTLASEMLDKYVDALTSPSYEFTMRDDPSLDVGMRVWLKVSSEKEYYTWNYVVGSATCKTSTTIPIQTINYSTLIPVVIQKIKSTFNGGMEATYTVITDNQPRV